MYEQGNLLFSLADFAAMPGFIASEARVPCFECWDVGAAVGLQAEPEADVVLFARI